MKITFFGAVHEVTGSRYFVEHKETRILVDCGLFQGEGSIAKNKWERFPIDPKNIDAIVLTHAHIDHTGYIPVLVKNGFRGKIYCSRPTRALSAILLADSGSLMEQNAEKFQRYHKGSHKEFIEPLYTAQDAERAMHFFHTVEYDAPFEIGSLTCTLVCSGHILGSSFIIISDGVRKLTFSGDLGRPNQPLMKNPPYIEQTDYFVLESTYGNRLHAPEDSMELLKKFVNKTVAQRGFLIIPAFAVDRAQMILYFLYLLRQQNAIPQIPIFLDSPMAIDVTDVYCTFKEELKLSSHNCKDIFKIATHTRSVEASKKLNKMQGPAIVVVGSGMADGGRVLEHFKHHISDDKSTVLFVGYQAKGTIGQALVDGARNIEIKGKWHTVNAEIVRLDSLSAHADYQEMFEWLAHFTSKPKKVFLTHGEIDSAISLKEKIEQRLGWHVVVPAYAESFELE